MNEYFPTVVQVIPLDNYHVQVFFDNGKIVMPPEADQVHRATVQELNSKIAEITKKAA